MFLPLYWGNLMAGDTYGLESWLDWQVTERWRLSPGLELLHEQLRFEPGASGLLGTAQAGDDPTHQALLKSSLDFGHAMSLDTFLRYIGSLPDPHLPSYVEMDARFGWRASKALELSLSGSNLLHAHHLEYAAPDGEEVPRTVYAEARWTF
jgi:iron complex outermembrane receptor protein